MTIARKRIQSMRGLEMLEEKNEDIGEVAEQDIVWRR